MSEHMTAWLSAYYDGELKGRQLRQVEAHLSDCAPCRAELDRLRVLSAMLRESPAASGLMPPEQFVAQVGLRLPRKPDRPVSQRALLAAWWIAPLVLLGVWVFLQTVVIVTGVTRVALDLSLGGELAAMLLPVESGGLWEGVRLNLILPGVIGLLYWSWLASWWVSSQRQKREMG
jgi:anti-sigma factor RsiW